MNTTAKSHASLTDIYMSVLAGLSIDLRLDLIAKLSASIREDASNKAISGNLRTMFCGDWTKCG
ncbi:MAG: hypothetical protein J5605_03535, partial [Bacteroidales bacterium]|nr:hypothetical protein [Bacteroidales bacterium]